MLKNHFSRMVCSGIAGLARVVMLSTLSIASLALSLTQGCGGEPDQQRICEIEYNGCMEGCDDLSSDELEGCSAECDENYVGCMNNILKLGPAENTILSVDIQSEEGRLHPRMVPQGSEVQIQPVTFSYDDVSSTPLMCDSTGWETFRQTYVGPIDSGFRRATFEYVPFSVFETLTWEEYFTRGSGSPWQLLGVDADATDGLSLVHSIDAATFPVDGASDNYVIRVVLERATLRRIHGRPPLDKLDQSVALLPMYVFGNMTVFSYGVDEMCVAP